MVALKPAEADAFVARPSRERPIVLVCGPDAGLVRERVEAIIRASVDDPRDPFALVHIEGDALAGDPARLSDEAHTVPLFGGRRAIWIRAGNRNFTAAIEPLLATPPVDCRIVIEAGDLRRNAPLRALCEKARTAAVIACYADGERELLRLIDEEMRNAHLTIAADARAALASLIGGDRQASRNEVRKVALYAQGKGDVVLEDVLAVAADASVLAVDGVIDAVLAGRLSESEVQFTKVLAAGTAPGTILSATLRHVMQLHRARLALDGGENPDAALGEFVPPIHFRRRTAVESALKSWNARKLARAIEQLADATRDLRAMRAPVDGLPEAMVQRALMAVASSARRSAA